MQSTADQIHLAIVGATGMVGGYALRHALDHAAVGSVTSVGRRKLGISHPKLQELLHKNCADCSALADALSAQDAAVYCLGTYTGSVSDAELRAITTDYTIEFARVLRSSSPNAAFSFFEREWSRPDGTKSDRPRTRQVTGREGTTRGRFPARLPFPARVNLPRGASEGTDLQLPDVTRGLSGVSGAFPELGNSRRRASPCNGGCCVATNTGAQGLGFREPRYPSRGQVANALGRTPK